MVRVKRENHEYLISATVDGICGVGRRAGVEGSDARGAVQRESGHVGAVVGGAHGVVAPPAVLAYVDRI